MISKIARLFFMLSLVFAVCSCAPTTLHTIPSGAAVYCADGKTKIGTTPFGTHIFLSSKNFTIRKEHYVDESVKLDTVVPRTLNIKLRRTPVQICSEPIAKLYPVGSETALGDTPMEVPVYNNRRMYILKAAGYYDQEITVDLESVTPIVVNMIRRPIVTLSASPVGVEVYEKGALLGAAPLREEIAVPRTFELRKAGYFTQTLTLTGAPPYEAAVELKPFPVVAVEATPSGAKIFRAGRLIGTELVELAVGEKIELEIRADRHYTQNITLTPDASKKINVALKAMPYVMINSEPAGAEVFIGGKSVGITPVEQLIEHDTLVELRKPGFITQMITLTADGKRVFVSLNAIPPPVAPALLSGTNEAAALSPQE